MTDLHLNAGAYVVGALSPSEIDSFENHLSDCPDCTKEVARMRDVTAQLSAAVATVPPPRLRSSILARIAETPQDGAHVPLARRDVAATAGVRLTSVPSDATSPSETPSLEAQVAATNALPSANGARRQSNIVPIRRSWASRGSALVAAAAVLGAVGFGSWAIQSRDGAIQSRDAAQQDAQVASQQADRLTQVLAATDLQTTSATFADGGAGTVVRSSSEGMAMLIASDVPALPEGQVYEAWTIDGAPVPAGTFSTDQGKAALTLPATALGARSIAVTVEPAGGSDHPTSDPVFSVDLATA